VKREGLGGAVGLCHLFLRLAVHPGDTVIDATCGNGHDTLFLAGLVGCAGKVWAFDVQSAALDATRLRLAEAGCPERVNLVNISHEKMGEIVPCRVRAVVFNLGFLPGSEDESRTCSKSTISALEQAAGLLLPGGVIVAAVYTGHEGGAEEASAVDGWASGLAPGRYNTWRAKQLNRSEQAPYVVIVEKSLKKL
jgi:precorrin-6B methylase 2